jgi:hypothetical protein
MDIKCANIFYARPYKIYPNWEFWFENIISGNPAVEPFEKLSKLNFIAERKRRSPGESLHTLKVTRAFALHT